MLVHIQQVLGSSPRRPYFVNPFHFCKLFVFLQFRSVREDVSSYAETIHYDTCFLAQLVDPVAKPAGGPRFNPSALPFSFYVDSVISHIPSPHPHSCHLSTTGPLVIDSGWPSSCSLSFNFLLHIHRNAIILVC